MGASVSNIIAALPDPFQRISLCRNIEQPLIGGGILHHGRSLAVNREHQVPLGFFKALQERRRIVSKRGKRLYVFGDVHTREAPFKVPIKASFCLRAGKEELPGGAVQTNREA